MAFKRTPQPHHARVGYSDLERLVDFLKDLARAHFSQHYPNLNPPMYEIETGHVNARIVKVDIGTNGIPYGRSVWGFVELASGAIMKAATYKAPEPKRYERGNIHQPENWGEWFSHYAPAYLK